VPAALTVEGLSVRFGGVHALSDVSLNVKERERGQPPYVRAGEGLTRTWQSTELFDGLSVAENLTVAVRDGAASDDVAKQTLALVGMDWAAEAMPTQLSSGQRKLVGVARALVAKPALLCLDEPAAGLDTAESPPEVVRKDPGVIAAYLGDDGTDIALTGTAADSPEGIL
jgi:ABC-type branched-subunit amino acid transport system ATPase component